MRTKIIIILCLIFVFVSCSKQKHVEIRIPVRMKQALNYKQYEKIFVGNFKIESSIESFNPENKLYDFFTKEFSQAINKKIEKLADFLGLSDRQRSYFKLLVAFSKARSSEDSRHYFEEILNFSEIASKRIDADRKLRRFMPELSRIP